MGDKDRAVGCLIDRRDTTVSVKDLRAFIVDGDGARSDGHPVKDFLRHIQYRNVVGPEGYSVVQRAYLNDERQLIEAQC